MDKEKYLKHLEAVKQFGYALEYVPKELIDREICLEAVKQNGWALDYVPKKLRDREVCLEAIKQNWWTLYYAPKEIIDKNMWTTAYNKVSEKDKDYFLRNFPQPVELVSVPDDLKSKEILDVAINTNPAKDIKTFNLQDISVSYETTSHTTELNFNFNNRDITISLNKDDTYQVYDNTNHAELEIADLVFDDDNLSGVINDVLNKAQSLDKKPVQVNEHALKDDAR